MKEGPVKVGTLKMKKMRKWEMKWKLKQIVWTVRVGKKVMLLKSCEKQNTDS